MTNTTCNCPSIDGYRVIRLGCLHHPEATRRRKQAAIAATQTPVRDPEADDLACAWADYRKDFGVGADHMTAAHKAFKAGWKAAREGDQSGVLS